MSFYPFVQVHVSATPSHVRKNQVDGKVLIYLNLLQVECFFVKQKPSYTISLDKYLFPERQKPLLKRI